MSIVSSLDAFWYPGYVGNWDDELFRGRLLAKISRSSHVLDLGAGAGIVKQMNFKEVAGRVCGIDVDPRVVDNPFLDEAQVASAEQIPYPDKTFDVVFADNVLEHLTDPERVFREVHRVLRPGGRFLAKTPNRRHYVALMARLSPHWFHRAYNRLRGRSIVDTFPTRYLANSPRAIVELASKSGLEIETLSLIEGRPEYLRISPATYFLGYLYERAVNSTQLLAGLRVLLLLELKKPGETLR
jgi:SAM-dependent methyltransferase